MLNRKGQTAIGTARVGVTLEGHARELIHHVDRVMRRLLATDPPKAEQRFSRPEIAVLDTLGAEGPMTMGELAGRLRLPLSTATRVVDGLVTRDLVARERPEENRRVVRVTLTNKGSAFYRVALTGRVAGARAMLQALTLDERRELIRIFRKIAASVTGEQIS